jgi:DNA-binding LytR/AlgR family response regulator
MIVDDEPLAQEVLENYIKKSDKLVLIKKCSNALEAFNVLHTDTIDLMFLDIKMPAISGIDFVRSLKHLPAIIFTTAYANYAITGFELDAVDYLLKQITPERFDKSIAKLFKLQPAEKPQTKTYSYFKVSGKLVKVLHTELIYAQSVKDYISLKTEHGNYLVHMTMKYLEMLLPPDTFVRVHRSYIINKQNIKSIGRTKISVADEIIPIGENYRANIDLIKRNN